MAKEKTMWERPLWEQFMVALGSFIFPLGIAMILVELKRLNDRTKDFDERLKKLEDKE